MFSLNFLNATPGPISAPASGAGVLLLIMFVALVLAMSALTAGMSLLWVLIQELLGGLFASLKAFFLLGLALVCVVLFALSGGIGPDDGAPGGPAPPTSTGGG